MSTLQATIELLENLDEDSLLKVYDFASDLSDSDYDRDVFKPMSEEELLAALDESRNQYMNGECLTAERAVEMLRGNYSL